MQLPASVKDFTQRRLLYALGRFQQAIDHVTVRFTDENGPRGGGYKCKLLLAPAGRGQVVVVEETAGDLRSAAARATDRAGRTLARTLTRFRNRRSSALARR
jgi:hypothetical protein